MCREQTKEEWTLVSLVPASEVHCDSLVICYNFERGGGQRFLQIWLNCWFDACGFPKSLLVSHCRLGIDKRPLQFDHAYYYFDSYSINSTFGCVISRTFPHKNSFLKRLFPHILHTFFVPWWHWFCEDDN